MPQAPMKKVVDAAVIHFGIEQEVRECNLSLVDRARACVNASGRTAAERRAMAQGHAQGQGQRHDGVEV